MEAVEGRTKDGLRPTGHFRRQPALGQQAQQVLVPEAMQLQIRMQRPQEIEGSTAISASAGNPARRAVSGVNVPENS